MSWQARRIAIATLLATGFWSGAGCQSPDAKTDSSQDLLPVEPPDLAAMGKGAQKQYLGLRQALLERLDADQAPSRELAKAWGEFGMWHHTYNYPETGVYCYRQAEELGPDDGRWPYFQGRILQLDGRFDEARRKYESVLKLDPKRVGPRLRLAELELEVRNPDQAERHFRLVLERFPDSGPALFGLGRIAFQSGDTDAAIDLLEAARTQHPDATRVHYHLAMAYRDLGELDRAQHHLEQIPDKNREQPRLPLGEPWDRQLNRMNQGPGAFRQRAMRARNEKQEMLATELFGRALAADPRSVEMKIAYARALDRIDQTEEAIEVLEGALLTAPRHPGVLVQMGAILARRGDRDPAEQFMQTAVELDPACLNCRRTLATLLRSQGRNEEALEHLSYLRSNLVGARDAFDHAAVLLRLGRDEEARQALEEDRRQLPEEESLRLLLARLLAASPETEVRDPQGALELLTPAPSATLAAAETIAMVEAALGHFDTAIAWQSTSVEAAAGQPKRALHRARRRLDLYQQGRGCLMPLERGEQILEVPINPPTPPAPPAAPSLP